jgi:hypothetical protein
VMYPLQHLLRTKLLLPYVQKELFHLPQRQSHQVYPGLFLLRSAGDCGRHDVSSMSVISA